MTDDRARVVALVPGYEEGPRIAAVVEAARRYLPVIVVDDGSTDDTAANAEAAGRRGHPPGPQPGQGRRAASGVRARARGRLRRRS